MVRPKFNGTHDGVSVEKLADETGIDEHIVRRVLIEAQRDSSPYRTGALYTTGPVLQD